MKRLFGTILISTIVIGTAFAHPPTSVDLTYDNATKILHIEVKHVSNDIRDHRVDKIIVYRNDEEAKTLRYVMQKPPGVTDEVIVAAEPGDILRVKVMSTEGGRRESSVTVPEDPESGETDAMDDSVKKK